MFHCIFQIKTDSNIESIIFKLGTIKVWSGL